MALTGTTGTGLDSIIGLIVRDYGLQMAISGASIRQGAASADGMNAFIIDAITTLGLANDGVITTSDVYTVNSYLRARHLDQFTALHGDDEGGIETGFHTVQGDGSVTRLFGHSAVDTVFDGLYHIAFTIIDGHFVNEDGNRNASVSDVATWLNELLAPELVAGTLANLSADPQVHGTTGTGLDSLIEIIVDDAGLNHNLSQRQINQGASAANGMAQIIVDAIRATGVADDGDLTALDMVDVNQWIAHNRSAEWTTLHGDDENGVETGFHLVQGDGGRTYLYDEQAVNTVSDGLFHLGFQIVGDRLVNEDGNANASLSDVADWLSLLLANDLDTGALNSGHATIDPATLTADIAVQRPQVITDDGASGATDFGNLTGMNRAAGTIALDFVANSPDDGMTHVLFSKDGATARDGDVTAFIHDGALSVLLQDGVTDHWITVEDVTIEAGQQYSFAMTFDGNGLSIWLNGDRVAVDLDATTGLDSNARRLVIGGGSWGRSASDPLGVWDHLDGTVSHFTVYDRVLDRFELAAINNSGALPEQWTGTAAIAGGQPAVEQGTGLIGEVFDRGTSFNSIDDLIAQASTAPADHHFTATEIDFGGHQMVDTLGAFLGDNATLTDGGTDVAMTTLGMHVTGFVWLDAGSHLFTVRSDDGFLMRLGNDELSSYPWGRGFSATSKSIDVSTSGLYAVDLYYFENAGGEGLRLELDGQTIGANQFFATVADYQALLAAHGEMPAGGLPDSYHGPVGTTGTGLDQLIRVIGEDQGLAANISGDQITRGAAAADAINHMIVEAVMETGALDDGVITVAETYDISDYIRANHYDAFLAAHGDDENGVETGFHLLQNDGGTSYLFGDDAVNTVMDGIYHIGFDTVFDRFVNEDGNANARVETVAWWLNELLGDAPLPGPGTGPAAPLGSATNPDVVVSSGLNSHLADGARSITLTGTANNATGNGAANVLTGNDYANLLDGGDGNDTLVGGGGDDMLIGGAGIDQMTGGNGNDSYWLDNRSDVVREVNLATAGLDTVYLKDGVFASYTLTAGIENVQMTGRVGIIIHGSSIANHIVTGSAADNIDSGSGDDEVEAGAGNDRLLGNAGNDWLDGGIGLDTMTGGTGNDSFVVDNAGDRVIEVAGEGTDTVYASVQYTLGTTVENLVLTGNARTGIGNAGNNRIDGNGVANIIDGGRGADRMYGGDGNDRYTVDDAGDRVYEMADKGIDTVVARVSHTLAINVENLMLGGIGNLDGTGNAVNNILTGNSGKNVLSGLGGDDRLSGLDGNDSLIGGRGADRLTGGLGADRFVYNLVTDSTDIAAGRDTINDFSHAEGDRIDLHLIDANGTATGEGAFHLAGAFDGTTGALTMTASGGGWLVSGDVDGDRLADFSLQVVSATSLVASDFIL